MLLAHGLFKAPLFLVTGIVDHATGTRDVRKLSGLWTGPCAAAAITAAPRRRRWPGCRRCSASSARRPAFEAFLAEDDLRGRLVTLALVAGSVFTVAYSARFLWGAFAPQARRRRHPGAPAGAAADVARRALRARRARARHREPRGRRRRAELRRRLPGHLPGRPATTSRCGTASACRCWRPPSRSCSATRCTAHGARSGGSPGTCRGRCRRSTPTSSPSAAPSASRRPSPAGCRWARSRPTSPSSSSPSSPCPARPCWSAARWPDQPVYHAPLQLPLAVLVTARGARPGAGPPPVHRGAAGRGGRLRRRRPVHRRRCPRSRAGPVPRRDAVAGRVRVRPAPDARPLHPGAAAGPGPGAQGRDRGRRGRDGRRDGGRAQRRPPGAADDQRRVHPARPGGRGRDRTSISAIIVDFRALDTVGEITVLFVAAVGVASLVLATPFDRRRRRRRAAPEARSTRRRSPRGPGREPGTRRRSRVGPAAGPPTGREGCDEPAAQQPRTATGRTRRPGRLPTPDPVRVVGPPAHGLAAAGPLPHPAPAHADARDHVAGAVPDHPRLLGLPALRRPLRSRRRVLRGARRRAGVRAALHRRAGRPTPARSSRSGRRC